MPDDAASHLFLNDVIAELLELLDTAAFEVDRSGTIINAAASTARVTLRDLHELIGSQFIDMVIPGDREAATRLFREASGGAAADLGILDGAGGALHCAVAARQLPGAPVRYACLLRKAHPSEAGIEERLRMFSMAVEQSPATVVITDSCGTITYVNPKFTSLTGYAFREAIGKNPRILKSGEQDADFYREMWHTISSGREWRGEFHNLKKNGEAYWESASISPIVGGDGSITHYVAVKEDITARKKAEEMIRVSEETLRNKNEDMERELGYAKTVVSRILPDKPPRQSRLKTDFRINPMKAIGGDFFSFNTLHDGGLGVFIGDVEGHGVQAALYLSLVKAVTERLFTDCGREPSRVIHDLNREFVDGSVGIFLTALYGFFDMSGAGATFRFAKGGHTPPVLYRQGEKEPRLLQTGGVPIGILGDAGFREMSVAMAPGDRVFLYTDGIIETRNRKNEMLAPEGLAAIVAASGGMTLGEVLDFILGEANRFREEGPAEDDMVIIGFEVER